MIVEFIKNIIKIVVVFIVSSVTLMSCVPSPWVHWFMLATVVICLPAAAYCMTYKIGVEEFLEKLKNL